MEQYVFGADIGGTTVKLGLFTQAGEKKDVREIPTRTENGGAQILPDIADAIRGTMTEYGIGQSEVCGIGMGAPGPVDANGWIDHAVNLGWGKMNLKESLRQLTGLPVAVGNDANVAAFGEAWKGSGSGCRNLLMVTLGTGIGGGIVADGKILTGASGAGGEIGHIHLEDGEEEACNCGSRGCFEQYCSATGAVRLANRLLAEKPQEPSVLRDRTFTCRELFAAARDGDPIAVEARGRYGEYLGKGLAVCATVLNPEIIVLGGGVSKAGTLLIDLLKPSFDACVFHGAKGVRFVMAALGNEAGIYGAARMVIEG